MEIVAARSTAPPAASAANSDPPATAVGLSPSERRRAPWRPAWLLLLAGLGLFLLALVPRLAGLDQHLTADDQEWVRRASRFGTAIQRGDLAATYQSGHPGVTVLWLAVLAIGPERAAELAARSGQLALLEKTPSYLGALFDARRALALAAAALTVLLAGLTWRLFGPGVGLLAGLLLAGEPFLVAHGQLFHTDPLLAQLMVISVLAALIFFDRRGGWIYLAGSGLAAGLAFLTKAPGLLLFGFVPLLGLAWEWPGGRPWDRRTAGRLIWALAIWGLAAGLAILLLWPALWVDAWGTLERLALAVRGVGESPRRWGNFFLGEVVAEDVGPLFYPVATLLRLSPLTLLGLALLGWAEWRQPRGAWWPRAVVLLAYAAFFTLALSFSPKKLDRYLLPVFPILAILAALGLWQALSRLLRRGLVWAAALAIGLAQLGLVASVYPYPLSFFNPLLGGTPAARQMVIVGWGEGLDQVAAYLDQQPNAEDLVVTTLYHDPLQAQFRGTGVPLWEWQRADYLVDYVNMDQRQLLPRPLRALVDRQAPEFSVWINGVEYACLYAIPPSLRQQAGPSDAPRGANVPKP